MNDTTSQRRERDSRFADPGRIAPSVDKAWRDELILELRLLDVPGDGIGDALVTVESHVVESGESAQEAFGDARTYARELAPRRDGQQPARFLSPVFIVGNLLGLLGLFVTGRAFTAWLEGTAVSITVGDVVSTAVLLGTVLVITLRFERVARAIMDQPFWAWVIAIVLLGAAVAVPTLLLRDPLVDVPLWICAVVGVALLLLSSVMTFVDGRGDQDEIVAPGQEPSGTGTALLTALMLPAATLVVLLITWIPTLFA